MIIVLNREDILALGVFMNTFNKRPDANLYFSEKLLTEEEKKNYEQLILHITELWRQEKKPSTPNNSK